MGVWAVLWPGTAGAAGCQFVLGFATLADAVSQVGSCLDDQASAANGDAIQHTTGGLLVWRKSDNWTAFTDGNATWVNGPNGIERRLNTERFPWESDSPAVPATPIASAQASATPAAATALTALYTPPTAASLGLSGASIRMLDPPTGPTPTAGDLATVAVPPGAPPLASLPGYVQHACFNLSQDMKRSDINGAALRQGDLLCPYASYTGWNG